MKVIRTLGFTSYSDKSPICFTSFLTVNHIKKNNYFPCFSDKRNCGRAVAMNTPSDGGPSELRKANGMGRGAGAV